MNYGSKQVTFLGHWKVILVYIGRWSYGHFQDDNKVFQKMKNDLTTGTWQDDIWCPINIILLCTSDAAGPGHLRPQRVWLFRVVCESLSWRECSCHRLSGRLGGGCRSTGICEGLLPGDRRCWWWHWQLEADWPKLLMLTHYSHRQAARITSSPEIILNLWLLFC